MTPEEWARTIFEEGREIGINTYNATPEVMEQLVTVSRVIKPFVDKQITQVLTTADNVGLGKLVLDFEVGIFSGNGNNPCSQYGVLKIIDDHCTYYQ